MVVMTAYGTGRLAGAGVQQGHEPGDSFQGIALADQFAFSWGRSAFLIGSIVPYSIARLGAGLLLALAPFVAGLYLFGATLGLFVGWIRGLAFCALGSFSQYLLQAIEVGLVAPWAQDVIAGRQSGALTPSAPTELLVMTLSFAAINLGVLMVCARVAFYPNAGLPTMAGRMLLFASGDRPAARPGTRRGPPIAVSRAQLVSEAVSSSMRQESFTTAGNLVITSSARRPAGSAASSETRPASAAARPEVVPGAKRTTQRHLSSTQRRDLR